MEKREEMVLLMGEFANSGLTQKEFSASKGMGVHKFNYWSRKLQKEKEETEGFVRVETGIGASRKAGQQELVYPNGVRLTVDPDDLSLLSRLIRLY